MKPLNQSEFDALMERRVNLVARTLQEIANTTDNNPALMDQVRFEKMQQFVGAHLQNAIEVIQAAMNRPQPMTLGTFSLGEPKVRKPRAKKAEVAVEAVPTPAQPAAASAAPTGLGDDDLGELKDAA